MNGNRFGTIFQVTTWGESHGTALGAVIDGCPSGLALSPEDFIEDMQRRSGGKASFTTARSESEIVSLESGVFEGKTTGTPISLRITNKDVRSDDYEAYRHVPRPGHADLTTFLKHEHRDHRGGGRSSARETAARVAASVIAKKILAQYGIQILSWVERVGPNELSSDALESARKKPLEQIKKLRDDSALCLPCADQEDLLSSVERLRTAGDSWGGSLSCRVEGLPAGLGEPVFDKLNAVLAHAMMSLPAAVAFECGGGMALSQLPGSAIRDPIVAKNDRFEPESNSHGGILGGMSSGLPLFLSIAFHAPTSVPRGIQSVDLRTGKSTEVSVKGRHDAFPLPRAVPMVEAMTALVLVDFMLRAARIPEKL
jgi:chorismate synthase